MLRIEKEPDTPSEVAYLLAGHATEEHLAELSRLTAAERSRERRVVFDLGGVVFADRAFVRFLVAAERAGIELRHCPAYVLSWMRCEGDKERMPR